jgi:hypothetical protein
MGGRIVAFGLADEILALWLNTALKADAISVARPNYSGGETMIVMSPAENAGTDRSGDCRGHSQRAAAPDRWPLIASEP